MFRSGLLTLLITGFLAIALPLPAVVAASTTASTSAAARHYPKVEVYGTKWCPYCRAALKYFRSRGIHVIEYDIEADQAAKERKSALDPSPGVPYVVIGGKGIHGYSAPLFEKMLKEAGAGS